MNKINAIAIRAADPASDPFCNEDDYRVIRARLDNLPLKIGKGDVISAAGVASYKRLGVEIIVV